MVNTSCNFPRKTYTLWGRPQSVACSCLTSGLKSPAFQSGRCLVLPSTSAPKVSLVGAFSSATESRFNMLESQLLMEKLHLEQEDPQAAKTELMQEKQVTQSKACKEDCWTKQLEWEKEKYAQEEAHEKSKEEKEEHLRNEKKKCSFSSLSRVRLWPAK
ncbi:hypothetical protein VP01_4993g2 [Puccinia sorghi]|uniref:Uncharacterized protein n=1 Tax=Puccinia sorghi TaxID=27349 RepID=A0A0L6ULT5_9BASI|nr:hypothetical protein VP01_4993g2 [Puccinia sorghi]